MKRPCSDDDDDDDDDNDDDDDDAWTMQTVNFDYA